MTTTVRVEYSHFGQWTLGKLLDAPSHDKGKEMGLEHARMLWRSGVDGVRVSVSTPDVILERMRG